MTTSAATSPGTSATTSATPIVASAGTAHAGHASEGPPAHLAFLLPDLDEGGAERVTATLAAGLARRGHRVDVVLFRAGGSYLDTLPESVRVVDLGTGRALWSVPAVRRYLRRERPDALVSALQTANLVALLAHRGGRSATRLIVTLHNTYSLKMQRTRDPRGRLLNRFMARAVRRADAIVAVSDGVAEDYARSAGLPRASIRTIYNPVVHPGLLEQAAEGVDHPFFAAGQPPVLVAAGRLVPQKDFDTLLHAFAEVRARRPARLLVLGEGSGRHALEALARSLGVEADVDLPGFERNPHRFTARAAAFVLSSRWEGLPTALIEAMALGTPVVSTDCPSGPREILGADSPWLVPVGDPEALAGAIVAALDAPPAASADEIRRRFGLDRALDDYLSLATQTVPGGPA